MKSMLPNSVAIFFMTYFYRAGVGLNIQFCQIFPKLHENGGRPKFYYVGPPLVKAPQLQSMVIYIFFKFGINYDNQNLKFNTYSCI